MRMANWQPLQSSNLRRCDYDIETGRLQIQFYSGKIYAYGEVPASVYNGLLEATSAGKFFNENIKDQYS